MEDERAQDAIHVFDMGWGRSRTGKIAHCFGTNGRSLCGSLDYVSAEILVNDPQMYPDGFCQKCGSEWIERSSSTVALERLRPKWREGDQRIAKVISFRGALYPKRPIDPPGSKFRGVTIPWPSVLLLGEPWIVSYSSDKEIYYVIGHAGTWLGRLGTPLYKGRIKPIEGRAQLPSGSSLAE